MEKPSTDEILKKYESKIGGQVNNFDKGNVDIAEYSKSYQDFRKSLTQKYSKYENLCKSVGNLIKIF